MERRNTTQVLDDCWLIQPSIVHEVIDIDVISVLCDRMGPLQRNEIVRHKVLTNPVSHTIPSHPTCLQPLRLRSASSTLLAQITRHFAPRINNRPRSRVTELVQIRRARIGPDERVAVHSAGIRRAFHLVSVHGYSVPTAHAYYVILQKD